MACFCGMWCIASMRADQCPDCGIARKGIQLAICIAECSCVLAREACCLCVREGFEREIPVLPCTHSNIHAILTCMVCVAC